MSDMAQKVDGILNFVYYENSYKKYTAKGSSYVEFG